MIAIQSNLTNVINTALERLKGIDINKMTREQASTLIGVVKERVHINGLDSNNSPIGSYTEAYIKVRSGMFVNADIAKKGKTKGKNKNSGKFTKGGRIGGARPNYNRGVDRKVILSLTRQMENDLIIKPVEGGWGIGYSNVENFKKALWAESTYHKKIWNLTPDERKIALQIAERYIEDASIGNHK